jgi:anti-sigma regulatory factor (Ser/Thr protein kinase)
MNTETFGVPMRAHYPTLVNLRRFGQYRCMEAPRTRWLVPATPDQVGRMRRAAAAAAAHHGLSGAALDDLRLAVSEALTNAVLHAYPDRAPGPIMIEVEADADEVRVTVGDEGAGLLPRGDRHGLGLGLGILATSADTCEIRTRRGSGMRVTLGFELNGRGSAPSARWSRPRVGCARSGTP